MAADISGNWSGTMQMGDNPITLTYAFKQDGEKVTGSVTTPHGEAIPLSDGKIAGDKITFYVQVDMGGNPAKFSSEGVAQRRRNYAYHKGRGRAGYGASDGSEARQVGARRAVLGEQNTSTQRRREHRDKRREHNAEFVFAFLCAYLCELCVSALKPYARTV